MTRVLLVDDDRDLLQALGALFQLHGFEVVYATDGVTALAQAQRTSPDLIITDWEMPRLDGIKLCRSLRALGRFANVPLVLTSGKEAPEGARVWDLFLRKPINFLLLRPVIRRAVGSA